MSDFAPVANGANPVCNTLALASAVASLCSAGSGIGTHHIDVVTCAVHHAVSTAEGVSKLLNVSNGEIQTPVWTFWTAYANRVASDYKRKRLSDQDNKPCDSARHAYVYKPCGTCITAMLMPVLYLGRVPKRQRARIRASRSWNLLSSPVVVPHNPFSSKNDSQANCFSSKAGKLHRLEGRHFCIGTRPASCNYCFSTTTGKGLCCIDR